MYFSFYKWIVVKDDKIPSTHTFVMSQKPSSVEEATFFAVRQKVICHVMPTATQLLGKSLKGFLSLLRSRMGFG